MNHGAATFDGNIRAHADHFAGVQKAVLENCFRDLRSTLGLRCQRHELRLHVRGEAGIFFRGHVGGNELFRPANFQRPRTRFSNLDSGLAQLGDDRSQMFRRAAGQLGDPRW